MKKIDSLLETYPRKRPPLSAAHWRVYQDEYTRNRSSSSGLFAAIRRLESWMHRQVSARRRRGERLLEIGAGTLNHVAYEKEVSRYEVIEPFESLWLNSPDRPKVDAVYRDIADIPESSRYDRIISIAVLEHLAELPWIVAATAIHLEGDGAFESAIPSEGHLLWDISWRLTTGISYWHRTGLNYSAVMHHEHINKASDILAVVSHFYGSMQIRRFPTPIPALSFYTAFRAAQPLVSVARAFLREHPHMRCQPAHVRGPAE